MPQILLDDKVFQAAHRKALRDGYSSVDEYIADVLVHDLAEETLSEIPKLDHLFTAQRLAEIDQAVAEVDAGNYLTAEQVREHFKQRWAACVQKSGQR